MSRQEEPDPIAALLARWRDGDHGAFDELVAAIEPWVLAEVRRAMRPGDRRFEESLDLAQCAIVNLFRYGPRRLFVPANGAQLRRLLRRIAMNELTDHRRRRRAVAEGELLGAHRSSGGSLAGFTPLQPSAERPERRASQAEESFLLRLALQYLEPEERFLLVASEIEGQDWATIAAELGIDDPNAARMRCVRLKPRLANVLRRLRSGELPPVPPDAPAE